MKLSKKHPVKYAVVIMTLAVLTLFVLLFISPGCVTQPDKKPNTFYVTVSTSGEITVRNQRVQLSSLAEKLKSTGAKASSPISVSITPDTTEQLMRAITKELRSGGFRRLVFTKPKKNVAFVNQPDDKQN